MFSFLIENGLFVDKFEQAIFKNISHTLFLIKNVNDYISLK